MFSEKKRLLMIGQLMAHSSTIGIGWQEFGFLTALILRDVRCCGKIPMSQVKLAESMGRTKRSIRIISKKLEEKELFSITHRIGATNIYNITQLYEFLEEISPTPINGEEFELHPVGYGSNDQVWALKSNDNDPILIDAFSQRINMNQ